MERCEQASFIYEISIFSLPLFLEDTIRAISDQAGLEKENTERVCVSVAGI